MHLEKWNVVYIDYIGYYQHRKGGIAMCKEKRYSLHQIFLLLDLYNDMADKVGKKPTKMTLISLRDGTDVRDFETEAQMIGYVKDTQPKKVQNRVLSADWTEVIPGTYRILTSGTLMELHVQ